MLLLLAVFIASAFVLVPEQAHGALAVELTALGVAVMALALVLSARRRPSVSADYRRPTDVATLMSIVAIAPIAVAGVSLLAGAGGGLYWLVPGFLACIGVALLDSWVLLVEIKR
jgi:modulator of FtsH protease